MQVDGFRGKGLVNSFFNGDDTTGTLTSPEFRIERKYIAFLIGGGKNDEKLALQLLVDGEVVRSATGPNDKPGGSEMLAQESWDVSEFAGRAAVLRIVDEAKGGWGHINVDHIVQTDTKPKGFVTDAERAFTASTRYLHIPIKNGAPKRVVTLLVDGKPVVRNDIELADGKPDWWAPMDVSAWRGKQLVLRVDKLHEDSTALGCHRAKRHVEGRRESLPRAAARAVPFFAPARLEQRPERPRVLQRRVSPLFPAQPVRLGVGQHALGPCGEQRPRPLGGTGRQALARRHGPDVQRQRGGGLEKHQRLRQGRQATDGALLHGRGKSHGAVPRLQHRWTHLHEIQRQPGA